MADITGFNLTGAVRAAATTRPTHRAQHAVDELQRRLRIDTEFDRVAYGPDQLSVACAFGAVETLLVTAEAASAPTTARHANTVAHYGGSVYVLGAAAAVDQHSAVSLVGGVAALLRFAIDGGYDDSAADVLASPQPSAVPAISPAPKHIAVTDVAAAYLGGLPEGAVILAISEEVADEFDVLEEIFPLGAGRETGVQFCRLGESAHECLLSIIDGPQQLILKAELPAAYPERPPRVSVMHAVGVTNSAQAALVAAVDEAVAAAVGEVALFTVATAAQEALAGLGTDLAAAAAA